VLLFSIKDTFIGAVANIMDVDDTQLCMRLFVPEYKFLYNFIHFFHIKNLFRLPVYFKLKNINGGAENGIRDGLKIQVNPETQGILGECFLKRTIVYGENLVSAINDYHFNDYQKQCIGAVDFCICVPLFDKSNNIMAIISIDSNNNLKVKDKRFELFNFIDTFRRNFQKEFINL
jgi:hypothetical protein